MSALCSTCSDLTFEKLLNSDVVFHKSLQALVRSAENSGCAFCKLCWAQIQSNCDPDAVDLCLIVSEPSSPGGGDGGAQHITPMTDFRVYLTALWNPPGENSATVIELSCGKSRSAGNELSTTLYVFADPGTLAAGAFAGRYIVADRSPELPLAASLAQSWLAYCRNHHHACNVTKPFDDKGQMPTRLIDIGHPGDTPRLILSQHLPGPQPYVALSYCWGEGVRHAIELNDENIADLFTALPEPNLTKTHRETIQFARTLGIRYIWIDSLCIIQGNLADRERESKCMGMVYGNAELTIIAGRAADSRNGFITNDLHTRTGRPLPVTIRCGGSPIDGTNLGHVYVSMSRTSAQGPVNGRGWCFQEYILSGRSICFGIEQITFHCRNGVQKEDGETTIAVIKAPQPIVGYTQGSKSEVLHSWYHTVGYFTQRTLTEPHDIFASISSIAQLAHRVLKCRYLAGLWEDDMPRGLLWKPSHHHRLDLPPSITRPCTSGRREGEIKGQPVIRAPSWSWARVHGPIKWQLIWARELHYCDPRNIFIRPRNGSNYWTSTAQDVPGEADALFMSFLELQFYGRLLPVRIPHGPPEVARREMEAYILSMSRDLQAEWGKMQRKYGVVLKLGLNDHCNNNHHPYADDGGLVVGAGFFDLPDYEITADLWCLRVVTDEGLLLRWDQGMGKFWRVGWVLVGGEGRRRFDSVEEVLVDLV